MTIFLVCADFERLLRKQRRTASYGATGGMVEGAILNTGECRMVLLRSGDPNTPASVERSANAAP